MSIAIAGERSGVGKTTVTLALLAALKRRQQTVQSFKVGPDYIDPMFHAYVTGRACRNLDPILTSPAYVQQCFDRHSQTADCALVEGVMGLFDGASGTTDAGSTAQVAKLLDLPVVLILNCSSTSRSIAAIAHGYRTFDPQVQVAGVILNQVGSDRHLELLTAALSQLRLPILGVLRRRDDLKIPDRHLGLIPAGELTDLNATLDRLAHVGETCFDWERLLPLLAAKSGGNPPKSPFPRGTFKAPLERGLGDLDLEAKSIRLVQYPRQPYQGAASTLTPSPFQGEGWGGVNPKIRIAVAKDAAFNFYYADNLDILADLGAELVEWSPLSEPQLPPDVQGLYFGGGFPEVFAETLAANQPARAAVKAAIIAGMPTYAECGGLMYLCDRIVDFNDRSHPMVGIFPTAAVMGKKLTLGYRQLTFSQDSLIANLGDRVWGHEFHRSTLTDLPASPLYNLQGYESNSVFAPEGWQKYNAQAAYTHLHFGARLDLPARFIECCRRFRAVFAS
ncbi:cobyrinate a,c-diamide synthase [Chamaesiphon sp. OTE_8_metabat_110]|uniref:cobyrinate a,c-diamide synthase n=1 Tax=Chamaesiphon sp. OTE_8_metabat_110 TaxID=2964696 RepID=UPI00286A3B77|nr:cobyrinate a,c-diamide synthase [Chamaesiphon sp. OTE_8_metabat_110]